MIKNPFIIPFFARMIKQDKAPNGLSWDVYKRLARLTAKINYGCDFKGAQCRVARETNGEIGNIEPPKDKNCCCACAECHGNLEAIQDEKDLKVIVSAFHDKFGFYRHGKGCILPRELRSSGCLSWVCFYDHLRLKDQIVLFLIEQGNLWGSIKKDAKKLIDYKSTEKRTKERTVQTNVRFSIEKLEKLFEKEKLK